MPTRTRAWMVGPVRGCELMTGTMLCAAVQHATADRVLCAVAAVAATASTCRQPVPGSSWAGGSKTCKTAKCCLGQVEGETKNRRFEATWRKGRVRLMTEVTVALQLYPIPQPLMPRTMASTMEAPISHIFDRYKLPDNFCFPHRFSIGLVSPISK